MKLFKLLLLIIVILIFTNIDVVAQCPMCKIAAESNLENGGTEGKGLNKGILYILTMPYLLVGTLGFLWWKNNRQQKEEERGKVEAINDLLKS